MIQTSNQCILNRWFVYFCLTPLKIPLFAMQKLPTLLLLLHLIYFENLFSQTLNQEDQIKFYNEKCKSFWETSLDSALYYGKKSIFIAGEVHNCEEASKSHLYYGVALYFQNKFENSIYHLEKGLKIAEDCHSLWGEGFANNMLCIVNRKNAQYDKAISYGLKTVAIRTQLKDSSNLAGAYQNLSNIYQLTGDPQTAIEYLSKSVDLYTKLKDSVGISRVQGNISNLYIDMDEFEKAEVLLLKSLQHTPKNSMDYANFTLNLGTIYQSFHQDFVKSEKYYNTALSIYQNIGFEIGIGMAYENLGELMIEKKNMRKALSFLKIAENKYEVNQDSIQISHIKLTLGKYYLKSEKWDYAQNYLEKAVEMGKERKISKLVSEGLFALYELHKKTGNSDYSLLYFERYTQFKDSLQKQLFDNRFSYWDKQIKNVEKERIIEQLRYDKERLKWKGFLFSLIILLLVVTLLLFFFKRKKDRQLSEKKRALIEGEKKMVEIELEAKKLKEKEMEYELEIKSKQLSSHALHMMQKNKMLQEVKTQMEELIDQSKMENKPDLRKINRMLDRNIKTEREWKLFKIYFEELNSGFFNKLKLINPVLTQNELKLCALTKLGFNLKETSSLLNVSINTIKNARYKLKIKLGIEKDASLKEYIDAML